jgi:hypothetical protein
LGAAELIAAAIEFNIKDPVTALVFSNFSILDSNRLTIASNPI